MKKSIPVHDIFESRRKFPRLKTNIPAFIEFDDGNRIDALIYDLSPDGAQIRYNMEDAVNQLHDDTPTLNIKNKQFNLGFELIVDNHIEIIVILCRPVYLRSVSEDMYSAGIVFDNKAETELGIINDYLIYQMDPSIDDFKSFMEMQSKERLAKAKTTDDENTEKKSDAPLKKQNADTHIKSANDEHRPNRTAKIDPGIENLKQEIIRMRASMKTLEDSNRLILEKLSRIERKL